MNKVKDSRVVPSTQSDLMRWAAMAGIAGPVLFTLGFLAQEQLRRGEYDPLSELVSALEAGTHGWIQQVNFVVLGVLTMIFAVGLHRGLAPAARGSSGLSRCSSAVPRTCLVRSSRCGRTPGAQPMTRAGTRSPACSSLRQASSL